MQETVQPAPRGELPRREAMQTPEEVAAMLRLKALGWGVRRIAGELGCSHMTVRRYLAAGGWVAYPGRGRPRTLSGIEEWVGEPFRRHAGNAGVVRQELEREKGIRLSLRTVEREVRHLRRELEAEARATIRFETPPGRQLQIDFGERRVTIGDETVKVYLFVATLGYSRRLYVRAFRNERQESWFAGVEGAFQHFGGITEQVLLDNDRRSPGPEQAFIIVTVAAVNRAFKGPSSLRPRSEAKRKGWECSGQLLALKRPAVAPAEGLLSEALLKHARYALERHP